MASIQGFNTFAGTDLYTSQTVPEGLYVGQLVAGNQGKMFRYVKAGASALVPGNVVQSPAIDTQFNDLVVTAAVAIGDTVIGLTNGTTAVTAGELIGGTAVVSVTPGLGQEFTIVGNGAAGNGAALSITVDRPLRVALTTSSRITIRKNPFNGVIQSPATTLTGIPVGVAIYAIAAGEFGFVQTHGVAGVLSDNTSIIAGSAVAVPSGTAGATTLDVAGLPKIGRAMQAAASGKCIPVFLTLD